MWAEALTRAGWQCRYNPQSLLPFSSSSIDALIVQDFAEDDDSADQAELSGQLALALTAVSS